MKNEDLHKDVKYLNHYIVDYMAFLESKHDITVKEIRVKRLEEDKVDITWKTEKITVIDLSEGD